MRRIILTSAASALLIFGGSASAANYADWDANNDKKITKSEFQAVFGKQEVFKKLDKDSDGKLSADELKGGVNADKQAAFNQRFGDDAFTRWDSNKDTFLDENEFNEGVYAGYDRNTSAAIEEPEFNDLGDDMGDGGFWDI